MEEGRVVTGAKVPSGGTIQLMLGWGRGEGCVVSQEGSSEDWPIFFFHPGLHRMNSEEQE